MSDQKKPRYVQVMYVVPVAVDVDLDTGAVHHVMVVDEEIRQAPTAGAAYYARDPGRADEKGEWYPLGVDAVDLADRGYEIAETAEWPAWSFGE